MHRLSIVLIGIGPEAIVALLAAMGYSAFAPATDTRLPLIIGAEADTATRQYLIGTRRASPA